VTKDEEKTILNIKWDNKLNNEGEGKGKGNSET
jgi:hypothetical protein